MKKTFYVTFVLALAGIMLQIDAQPNQNQPQNKPNQQQATNANVNRMIEYDSLGVAVVKDDNSVKNSRLERKLKYVSKESKTSQLHEFLIEDGKGKRLADTKPDHCKVINKETGLTVDEYNVTFTCNKHFGGAAYRDVIEKLTKFYANQFQNDIKQNKGILTMQPSRGVESIEYKSPARMTVTLRSNGVEYTAIANIDEKNKILATHTFIVKDPNKGPQGARYINIILDFSKETQAIIEPLARFAVTETGIWVGSRKAYISNQSDILQQF